MDDNKKKTNFIEWLGFKSQLDFSRSKTLGSSIGFILILLTIIFVSAILITLINFLFLAFSFDSYSGETSGNVIRNSGLVLAALLGLPFVIWRSVVAAKQASIADEALFNDKIDSAAKGLAARQEITRVVLQDGKEVVIKEWSDDLVTRAAAISRLEGLSVERKEISPRIVRLLATYVRGNFPKVNLNPTEDISYPKTPRMDMQLAVNTIGRIHKDAVEMDKSQWRLDLKGCDFDGVSFLGGFFWAADFRDCRFEASMLADAIFEGCIFSGSLLNFADFRRSKLIGAKFDRVILNRPEPVKGGFVSSINLGELRGATFIAADISALDYLGSPDVISTTFGTKDTNVSEELRYQMPSEDSHRNLFRLRKVRNIPNRVISEEDKNAIEAYEKTGFHNWSPFPSNDMATSHILEELYEELDMKKWPYY